MLVFEIPSRVIFGQSAASQIGSIVRTFNAQAALIICDQGVKAAGIMRPIFLSLQEAKIAVSVFDQVTANPSDSLIAEAAEYAKNLSVDIVIAVGGGSSLDAAKAINILLTNDGPIQIYEGMDQVKHQTLPLIAIPTTSGTGSEVTSFSIITDSLNKRKMVIGGKFVGATIALLDPELTVKLPPAITAATGMDAMTHAIEAHFSSNASIMSDVNALKAIELLYENLEIAVKNGDDIEAREAVMLGSMLAGFAFNSAVLGLAHAIAHPLGALYNIPHGVANAMVLPYVVAFNGQGNGIKITNIGKAMGLADGEMTADQVAKKIAELNTRISIPKLRKYIQKSDFSSIVSEALVEPSLLTNPRKVEAQDIQAILENAF
ncbi:MAG: alcohol dehydrogenase [Firmicutes bacterium]|nr:alcohol dehydrogenase [Bacillota bacterium]